MMKKTLTALSLAALTAGAVAAPEVTLTTSSPTVSVGDVFSVLVSATSFDAIAGKSIDNISGAKDLVFSFTNNTLEFVSLAVAPQWTFGVNLGTVNAAAGTITGVRFGSFPAVTGTSFQIGTVTLKAIGAGAGKLDLVSGTFQGKLSGVSGQSFTPAMGEVSVAVTSAVPEPTSVAMLLAGLGGLGFMFKRRASAA